MRKPSIIASLAIAGLGLSSSLAMASPITGTFAIANTSGVTVGLLFNTFGCQAGIFNAPCPAPANYGNFAETGTADFAGLQGGYIHNLDQATTPVGGGFILPNFIIFASAPNIVLDLNMIFVGVDSAGACETLPATPGQTCTPQFAELITPQNPTGLSPLNLQNLNGGGSTASFSVAGLARNVATGEISNFNGLFTAQFTVPYQTLLATVRNGGTVTNSYSSTFAVTVDGVPEPSSMFMMMGGLLIVGALGIRRLARRC